MLQYRMAVPPFVSADAKDLIKQLLVPARSTSRTSDRAYMRLTTARNTMCGTRTYLPSEMLKPSKDENWYSERVDLWSIGVLTPEFLCSKAPFEDTLVMTQRRLGKDENWYSEKVDLWSLGVLTYEFLCAKAPFEDTPLMTQRRIAPAEMPVPPRISGRKGLD
ncbi:spindle assembly checkpoint kinase [Elasticomyces elasticus]|nr:spindle assembly checkpoint kinase [Elasticomyces elasticus]